MDTLNLGIKKIKEKKRKNMVKDKKSKNKAKKDIKTKQGYTYYMQLNNVPMHYLFSEELALLYGICTEAGRPHTRLVSAYLGIKEKEMGARPLYYNTRYGLKRVYPHGEAIIEQLRNALEEIIISHVTLSNGKSYNFKLKDIKHVHQNSNTVMN